MKAVGAWGDYVIDKNAIKKEVGVTCQNLHALQKFLDSTSNDLLEAAFATK